VAVVKGPEKYVEDEKPTVVEPPFYLMMTECNCWQCGQSQTVCALACARVIEGLEDAPAYLKYIDWLPRRLREEIATFNSKFCLSSTKTSGSTYYANTCECGAVIDDHYLHQPDEAFFPMDEMGIAKIRVMLLNYSESFRSEAQASWGAAEQALKRQAEKGASR